MIELVLENARLIEKPHEQKVVNIGIDKGQIVEISHKKIKGKQSFDCAGKLVTTSFVNGHSHTAMSMLKGMAEDVSIKAWFNEYIWPYEQHLTYEDVYHGAKVGFSEMIREGITIVADHYMLPKAVIQAALDVGIRLDMAPTLFSFSDFDKGLQETIELSKQYQNHTHISISYGPHSLYTVDEKDMLKIVDAHSKYPLKMHLHVSETVEQVNEHFERTKEKPGDTFKRLNLHKIKTIIAHGLGLSKHEQEGLENAVLVFCPKTYLKLSMPIEACYQKELPYIFGTDGPASNNTVAINEQASIFSLFGKWYKKDETAYPVNEMFQSILRGHQWFNFNTGKVEVGYNADLILWNLERTHSACALASIIHEPTALTIDKVMCHGQWLNADVPESEVYLAQRQKELLMIQKHSSPLVF